MKAIVEAKLYRDAGAVDRYHVKRTIRRQSVGEHSFGVLMLIKQVLETGYLPQYRETLVYNHVLHHDLPELFTGDTPGPVKRANVALGLALQRVEEELAPLYREYCLNSEEGALVKWADRMELVLWCLEEVRMGNSFAEEIVARGLGWILASRIPDCALELTHQVVADAQSVGIVPDSGTKLEMNA